MPRTIHILVALFLLPYVVHCYEKAGTPEKPRHIARKQIKVLKNGALLIRLTTKSYSIEALRKGNQNEKADKIQQKQARVNQKIVKGFNEKFNFCPVYFFFSDYTQYIKNDQPDKVVFLHNLQPDSSIKLNGKGYLIAEFGRVEQDTGKYRDRYTYYYKDELGLQKRSTYYAGPVFGFDALIIKSNQFVQMRYGRFPYHVRTWGGIRSQSKAISILNKRLHRYYRRHA